MYNVTERKAYMTTSTTICSVYGFCFETESEQTKIQDLFHHHTHFQSLCKTLNRNSFHHVTLFSHPPSSLVFGIVFRRPMLSSTVMKDIRYFHSFLHDFHLYFEKNPSWHMIPSSAYH